ncbi:meiotic nuclear division protein 1 homolog [Anthonomus grandis grandis]|uniref:meiotic nuclear division protein 1 homolog n=1 Tax=Anthonomus grandis grandis TaxID=2921223 RepID=UPI002165F982|nr:meiotic nuclear division protein 1 homolog [Anthonomus grandis grandis]
MSKKGVSAEEKRTRMLELFYQKGECFQLKELEKIAPKEKGIVANSVKDVISKLVDDGLIETDKIGTSIYFWAFPSKAVKSRKRKLEEVTKKNEETSKKLKLVEEAIEQSKSNEGDTETIDRLQNEITELELDVASMEKTLAERKENDAEKFEAMRNKAESLKEAANRWTENVFSIKSWCKKKFFMEDKVLDKQFGIPEDFDYIE